MSLKTRADIALEKQKLREAERQIIAKENLALGSEIAKGRKPKDSSNTFHERNPTTFMINRL